MIWVLIIVLHHGDVILTAAAEFQYRSDCVKTLEEAKQKFPNFVSGKCELYAYIDD